MPKEYIEREALLKRLEESNDADNWIVSQYNADWIYSFIDTAPTADAVEVVRCGECVHSKKRNKEEDTVMCLKYMAYKGVKGFCDEGERKSK